MSLTVFNLDVGKFSLNYVSVNVGHFLLDLPYKNLFSWLYLNIGGHGLELNFDYVKCTVQYFYCTTLTPCYPSLHHSNPRRMKRATKG